MVVQPEELTESLTAQAAEQVTTHFMNQHLMPQASAQVTDSEPAVAVETADGLKIAENSLPESRVQAVHPEEVEEQIQTGTAHMLGQELQTAAAVAAVAAGHTTPMAQAAAQV